MSGIEAFFRLQHDFILNTVFKVLYSPRLKLPEFP